MENKIMENKMSAGQMRKKIRAMMAEDEVAREMMKDKDLDEMDEDEMRAMMAKMQSGKSNDMLVAFGGELKSLGGGKYGGYLVKFTAPGDYDLTQDRFDAKTDFGFKPDERIKTHFFFHHAQPLKSKSGKEMHIESEIGDAEIWLDAEGVAIIAEAHKEYQAMLDKSIKSLGWSSGAPNHLVKRVKEKNGFYIKRWFLGSDASLTPTPAEHRNQVIALKSLRAEMPEPEADAENEPAKPVADAVKAEPNQNSNVISEANQMSDELKAIVAEALKPFEPVVDAVKGIGERLQKVENALKAEPPKVPGTNVTVVLDEADRPFRSLAEQCQAVKAYKLSSGDQMDVRLKRLTETKAASGAVVGVSSEGGFLVEPTLTAEILKPVHEIGAFSSRARRLPVGSNSNYGWINGVDETDRATGSRWGGIRGYRIAEGNPPSSSKPKFRRINWELKKYAVLVYGTDELLADAAQWSAVVNQASAEELAFMVNDDILNGDGAAGCFGVLSSAAAVSITRTTTSHVVYEDLVNMWARCDSRSKPNSAWFINTDVNPDLDTLAHAVGTAALEPKFVGYDQNGLMRIKGRPVVETEFNATLGTVGDILLLDMSQYLTWEKGGVQAAESMHVLFTTDETAFRFIYRTDGQPSIASPLTPYKGTGNTISPFVKLAT